MNMVKDTDPGFMQRMLKLDTYSLHRHWEKPIWKSQEISLAMTLSILHYRVPVFFNQ